MLAKIAPRFVISRVIQTSYYANYMAVELSKQIIGESGLSFYYDDPKKYYVNRASLRNATSTASSLPWPHLLSLLTSSRPSSTIKLSKN
jgi:hypothetical protein